MVVSPIFPCGYKLDTSVEFRKPEVPRDGPLIVVLTFYAHGSVMMEHVDVMAYIH